MGKKELSREDRLRLKRRIIEEKSRRNNSCQYCNSKSNLEFAHIIPTKLSGTNSRGSWSRYNDIIQNPQCYLLLCHSCHTRLDTSFECDNSSHKLFYYHRLCYK